MAELNLLAFLQNCLTTTSSEQGTLENLLYTRLLTGNFTINSSGVVSFLFAGKYADGTVAAPSDTFTNEPTSGRYRIGANNIGESINSTKVLDWNATRLQITGLNLIWGTDNAQDIGASGANRPRDFFLGRNASIAGTLAVTSTSVFTGAVTLTGGLNTPLASAQGGTGSAFFAIAGPASLRTFTLPDASATVLTSNAAVTVAQGGTGLASGTSGGVPAYTASGTITSSGALAANAPVIGGGAGAVPSTITAGTAGQVLAGSSGAPAFVGGMTLLQAGSGTSVATVATNVATYALASQLTAKDSLVCYWTIEQAAQTVTTPRLYNVTDSVTILDLSASLNFAAGHTASGTSTMRQGQTANTVVLAHQEAFDGSGSGNYVYGNKATFATAWTGAWTWAFGFASQTSGGTFAYSYALYRVAGQ